MAPPRTFTRLSSPGVFSNVHLGRAFEIRSLELLQAQFSMSLTWVGGAARLGRTRTAAYRSFKRCGWWLPDLEGMNPKGLESESPDGIVRRRIRVLGQCKAEKRKLGPKYVREMEGVLARHHMHAEKTGVKEPTMGVFVSQSPFTRSAILRAYSSSMSFFLLHLPPETQEEVDEANEADPETEEHDGFMSHIGAAIWNPALGASNGLLQGRIEVRWERSLKSGLRRPGLWFMNKKLQGFIPPRLELDIPLQ
ncbi:hypothetical protein M422DRAFT_175664 [Sphaerobolus stellatus SS14]|uniref:Restriction endonuclease type IV Mrr domain-containing protein n=1 Tax=Sphaerobolus stellatus (strain SS14) TaxID=990650 RepID=A0A0C9U7T5_SPHS4|nr:hypothetical protein M422DRAFT_175664 [Sphaerobolus stellatus SS14]